MPRTCKNCTKPIPATRRSNARHCSDECRTAWGNAMSCARSKQRIRSARGTVKCANRYCDQLLVPLKDKQFCGADCLYVGNQERKFGQAAGESAAIGRGQLDACRVYFWSCKVCGTLVCARTRAKTKVLCSGCRSKWMSAHNAKKNHARRAAGPKVISVYDLAIRDGQRCHLCRRLVDMALKGTAKWGPTIDHLVPVSRGGTNDPANLALAHRYCNTRRSNRGPAQMALIA
jgi:5-methylcytosine-specific restriction endonuclease McrA